MKKRYETTMINTGGREGASSAPDNSFTVKIERPGAQAHGGTNPEQLFAAGYSACFNGALSLVMQKEGLQGESTVSATVSLYTDGPEVYVLGVALEGHVSGVSLEKAEELLHRAHGICPYSKATKGNIEVSIKAV